MSSKTPVISTLLTWLVVLSVLNVLCLVDTDPGVDDTIAMLFFVFCPMAATC